MRLSFDSIDEVKEFVTNLKGVRGKKGDGDDVPTGNAPAPLQPPTGGQPAGFPGTGGPGFAPPAGGAGPAAAGPFAAGAPAVAPEVQALVTRITGRIDGLAAAGQDAGAMLTWFRSECSKAGIADAANATWDNLKSLHLPKLSVPALENIAKLTGA